MNSSSDALSRANIFVEKARFEDASMTLLGERALQRRVDTKFILSLGQLEDALSQLGTDYSLVRANGAPVAEYSTLYFDTQAYLLLTEHHRGRRPRYKVRIRHYTDRTLSFLEVKRKNNADKTVKARREITYLQEELTPEDRQFVADNLPLQVELAPTLRTDFGRITVVGKHTMERATFDINLQFRGHGDNGGFPELVIAEIKQDRYQARTPMMLAFRQLGLQPIAISKYCTAGFELIPELRLNRFQPLLRSVRKTCNIASA